jgi:lipopolysaccharide heptosyltransferase II
MARLGTLIVDTSFLGDVLCAEPLVRAVAERWPKQPVDFLAGPAGSQMLVGHPQLRDLMVFDKRNADKGLGGLRRAATKLRRKNYARAICSHRSWRTALLLRLAGIPERVGFHNASAAWLYSKRVRHRSDLHEVERNLELVGGGVWNAPRMYPGTQERARATELLAGGADVALAPGSIWATKRWPAKHWTELVSRLLDSGRSCVLLGGPDDEKLCAQIAVQARSQRQAEADGGPSLINLAGQTSLRESAAVLEQVSSLVSNDSAPMHLGVAAGIPVVAVFCSTVASFGFAPRGPHDIVLEVPDLACRPCGIHGHRQCPKGHFDCGEKLSVVQVYAATIARVPV